MHLSLRVPNAQKKKSPKWFVNSPLLFEIFLSLQLFSGLEAYIHPSQVIANAVPDSTAAVAFEQYDASPPPREVENASFAAFSTVVDSGWKKKTDWEMRLGFCLEIQGTTYRPLGLATFWHWLSQQQFNWEKICYPKWLKVVTWKFFQMIDFTSLLIFFLINIRESGILPEVFLHHFFLGKEVFLSREEEERGTRSYPLKWITIWV